MTDRTIEFAQWALAQIPTMDSEPVGFIVAPEFARDIFAMKAAIGRLGAMARKLRHSGYPNRAVRRIVRRRAWTPVMRQALEHTV